jgi:hypothetical protein
MTPVDCGVIYSSVISPNRLGPNSIQCGAPNRNNRLRSVLVLVFNFLLPMFFGSNPF